MLGLPGQMGEKAHQDGGKTVTHLAGLLQAFGKLQHFASNLHSGETLHSETGDRIGITEAVRAAELEFVTVLNKERTRGKRGSEMRLQGGLHTRMFLFCSLFIESRVWKSVDIGEKAR